jgi:hypothetical protein
MIMKKFMLFSIALLLATAAYSQTAGRQTSGTASGKIPVEVKEKVYFQNGKLDEYKTLEWDDSYTYVKNEARYSASGVLLGRIEFVYHAGKGYVVTKIIRDSENRLKNGVVYEYNLKNQLLRERLEDSKRNVVSSKEYSYDVYGNRISRVLKNKAGVVQAETQYVYDDDGKMIISRSLDSGGNPISHTRYTYDDSGNLIGQEVFNEGYTITSRSKIIWKNGHDVKNEIAGADGSVQVLVTNEYGKVGELTKKTIENAQNESRQTLKYEYTYIPSHR